MNIINLIYNSHKNYPNCFLQRFKMCCIYLLIIYTTLIPSRKPQLFIFYKLIFNTNLTHKYTAFHHTVKIMHPRKISNGLISVKHIISVIRDQRRRRFLVSDIFFKFNRKSKKIPSFLKLHKSYHIFNYF